MLKMIVAISKNGGIGLGNSLPWKVKTDMEYFKSITKGKGNNCVVMGKNTWDSIDSQIHEPLPKRDKIVMSRNNLDITTPNTQSIKSISELFALCNKKNYDDIFVIGGEQIYSKFLEERLIDTVYITEIQNEYKCDTFFPQLPNDFYISHTTKTVWENDIGLRFTTWKKREVCEPGIIVTRLHAF